MRPSWGVILLLLFLVLPLEGVKKFGVDVPIPKKAKPVSKAEGTLAKSKGTLITTRKSPAIVPPSSKGTAISFGKAEGISRNHAVSAKSLFSGLQLSTPEGVVQIPKAVAVKPPPPQGGSSSSSSALAAPHEGDLIDVTSPFEGDLSLLGEKRKDVPDIRTVVRGNKKMALEAVKDKAEALKKLNDGKFAASSLAPRDSLLKTWMEFHQAWFQNEDYFPLTTEIIDAVGAMFRAGEYRSVANYFSRAQDEHGALGHDWNFQLTRARRLAVRAVTRGMGPPRQSQPLPIEKIIEYCFNLDNLLEWEKQSSSMLPEKHVPFGWVTMILVGSLFLMREIEVAAAKVGHVTIDVVAKTVSLLLPVSKTDIYALGKTRTWSCICSKLREVGEFPDVPCVYHLLKNHLEKLHTYVADQVGHISGEAWNNVPLFPTRELKPTVKEFVVRLIEVMAETLGLETRDGQQRLFGGHSMRVSGARFLASLGMEINKIMLFARWMSIVVLRYVEEAPLVTFSQEVRSRLTQASVLQATEKLNSALERLEALEKEYEKTISKIEYSAKNEYSGNAWLLNLESKAIHKVEYISVATSPSSWYTACRWSFAAKGCRYKLLETQAEKAEVKLNKRNACDRCFPHYEIDDE